LAFSPQNWGVGGANAGMTRLNRTVLDRPQVRIVESLETKEYPVKQAA
jgi:hypothetical protein